MSLSSTQENSDGLKAELRSAQAVLRAELKRQDTDQNTKVAEKLARAAAELAAMLAERGVAARKAVVAGYWPIKSEIDSMPLMRACAELGLMTALPATPAAGHPLIFHRWTIGTMLIKGSYGTSEPVATAPVVTPNLVLAPLLAFDRRCYRLGYGGGFYDRSLAEIRGKNHHSVLAVGLAYAEQEVSSVPIGDFDAKLDVVLTEKEVIKRRD